jgi:hypothetical protein
MCKKYENLTKIQTFYSEQAEDLLNEIYKDLNVGEISVKLSNNIIRWCDELSQVILC